VVLRPKTNSLPQLETRDVMVRLAPESRGRVQDLESLPLTIAGPEGRTAIIPLGHVARIAPSVGPRAHRPSRSRAPHHGRGEYRDASPVGGDRLEALIQAGRVRLRPILMTSSF